MSKDKGELVAILAIFRKKKENKNKGILAYTVFGLILSFVAYVLDIILTAIFYKGPFVFILIYTVFVVIPVIGCLYLLFSTRKKKTKQTLNRK